VNEWFRLANKTPVRCRAAPQKDIQLDVFYFYMNILFVCSANKLRSLTAEDYFSSLDTPHVFISTGTNLKTCFKEGRTPLEEWMLEWADIVYVMEKMHKSHINNAIGYKYDKKIVVLNIKDNYRYYQPELISLLEKKINFNQTTS